jgi:hypothetical protein
MKTTLEVIWQTKLAIVEFLKDSPLVLYVVFYEPFHDWLMQVAVEWNPILKFFLNILMLTYGLFRFVSILRNYVKGKQVKNDGGITL